jgi:alkylation response protein AidB-like acyl-CoA dehydrogenase
MTTSPTDALDELRAQVRSFVSEVAPTPCCDSWMRGPDRAVSAEIGRRGWIGMTWPECYGGRERSNTERLVVTEELLRHGVPVTAHWTADRQIGPAVLRLGTEAQREALLPAICRGEVVVGLGLSESEAGSDLAAVRTRAERVDGGWKITGTKIWTTSAHIATHLYVLARSHASGSKHEGLTEFLLPADAPGISIRPIEDLVREHHFNEVHFDGAFASDANVLGEVGRGWTQVTDQLAFERGGAERYLSTYPLLAAAVAALQARPDRAATERVGATAARLAAVRRLGYEVALALDAGHAPGSEAAELKLAGTHLEKEIVETARYVLDVCGSDEVARRLLAEGITSVPGGSIRGGVSSVMRTLIARGAAGNTARGPAPFSAELREVVDDVLGPHAGMAADEGATALWNTVTSLEWPYVGIAEDHGGAGGDLADVLELARGAGRHTVSLPLGVTLVAGWVLAEAGLSAAPLASGAVMVVSTDGELTLERVDDGWRVRGALADVPWLPAVRTLVVVVPDQDAYGGVVVGTVPLDGSGQVRPEPDQDLAEEPRASVVLDTTLTDAATVPRGLAARARARADAVRAAEILGALENACALAVDHVGARVQFGKPLAAFQAVGQTVADIVVERDLTAAALRAVVDDPRPAPAEASRAVAARAACVVAEGAHQLLGAMGITREHTLHHATRRLWSWRDAGGSQRSVEQRIGEVVVASDGVDEADDAALWSLITGG